MVAFKGRAGVHQQDPGRDGTTPWMGHQSITGLTLQGNVHRFRPVVLVCLCQPENLNKTRAGANAPHMKAPSGFKPRTS